MHEIKHCQTRYIIFTIIPVSVVVLGSLCTSSVRSATDPTGSLTCCIFACNYFTLTFQLILVLHVKSDFCCLSLLSFFFVVVVLFFFCSFLVSQYEVYIQSPNLSVRINQVHFFIIFYTQFNNMLVMRVFFVIVMICSFVNKTSPKQLLFWQSMHFALVILNHITMKLDNNTRLCKRNNLSFCELCVRLCVCEADFWDSLLR